MCMNLWTSYHHCHPPPGTSHSRCGHQGCSPFRLVYDSCQINQFNRVKMWKCIDSITMNRHILNISINSIMLLHMNRLNQITRITQMIQSNQSINSIYCWSCSENLQFCWLFFKHFLINWINSIIPVAEDQSAQSHTLWKRIDSITN